MSETVFRLAHKLPGVPQPFQLPNGVTGEVSLDAHKGLVVVHPQAIHLLGEKVFIHLPAHGAHLGSGDMVYHLGNAKV